MSDIGKDEWDLFYLTIILEIASLYRDELELEPALFNDDGERNKFFEIIVFFFWQIWDNCFIIWYFDVFRFSYWF
jgi:hypothetical protein